MSIKANKTNLPRETTTEKKNGLIKRLFQKERYKV